MTAPAVDSVDAVHGARRWLRLAPLIATIAPPALIAWTVWQSALNVPFLDDWQLVPLLEKAQARTLGFGDFWAQHNEHRPVLAKMVLLALARVTAWDVRWEMAASVVVALMTLGVLGMLIVRTTHGTTAELPSWLLFGASLLTFSLVEWQNWLWGWQLQVFMNALAAAFTVWVLERFGSRGAGPALALASATLGALSFASGLLLFVIVPLGLALDADQDQRRRWGLVGLTALAGAGITVAYLVGLEHPPQHPSVFVALSQPLGFVEFVLAYLGAPLGIGMYLFTRETSIVVLVNAMIGAIGLAGLIVGAAWLHARSPASPRALRPWLLLALYGVGSGMMTAVGRLGDGLNQALGSRYTTISALFWVSVLVVVALAMTHALRDGTRGLQRAAIGAVAVVGTLIIGVGYQTSSVFSARLVAAFHHGVQLGGECLQFHPIAPDPCLKLLNPEIEVLRDHARRLEALGLGPFATRRAARGVSAR